MLVFQLPFFLLMAVLAAGLAFAQAPRGAVSEVPSSMQLLVEIDRQLATDPEAWRNAEGKLPASLLLKLGMNPTDRAAARAYVLFVERKTLRTALAQALVTVEQHRRNLELLEVGDPSQTDGARKRAGLTPVTGEAQAALLRTNLIADEKTKFAEAERRYAALLAAFQRTSP
jgi:hypothetical protein